MQPRQSVRRPTQKEQSKVSYTGNLESSDYRNGALMTLAYLIALFRDCKKIEIAPCATAMHEHRYCDP